MVISITRRINTSLHFVHHLYGSSTRKFTIFHSDTKKVIDSVLHSGQTVLIGGFGICGVPENLIDEICKQSDKINNLTIIGDGVGISDFGTGKLIETGQVSKVICSFIGNNHHFERLYIQGKIKAELVPQGTLAEKLRCGGSGIPAFYTSTGIGSELVENAKEKKIFGEHEYILETSITGDVALIKAWKSDMYGNLIFRESSRNFNPLCAMAAKTTIAEVEEIVTNHLDPDMIHLPRIYVDHVVKGKHVKKRIERLVFEEQNGPIISKTKMENERYRIARQIAKDIHPGMYVNLGIGIPMLIAEYIKEKDLVLLQSENGILGMGHYPNPGKQDADLINAGKETVTVVKGASFFDSSESFSMIRGGHINIAVMGGLQVSQYGDLANWIIPGKKINGMGGAMDLAAASCRSTFIIIAMTHTTKDGRPKILPVCNLPLTAKHCVNRIVTEIGVFDVLPDRKGLLLVGMYKGTTVEEIRSKTPDCLIQISNHVELFE